MGYLFGKCHDANNKMNWEGHASNTALFTSVLTA